MHSTVIFYVSLIDSSDAEDEGDRLANPTLYSLPRRSRLKADAAAESVAERLTHATYYTVPGKARLREDAVEEHFMDLLEKPSGRTRAELFQTPPVRPKVSEMKNKEIDSDEEVTEDALSEDRSSPTPL